MNTSELRKSVAEQVERFVANDGRYDDDTQLRIDRATMTASLTDGEEDNPDCDYYDIMDLVEMSVDVPGTWMPDQEAIDEVAASYA